MLNPQMNYSKSGYALTEQFESCAKDNGDCTYSAYWDAIGKVWTIGYGSTGPGVQEGTVWTLQQCVDDLNARMAIIARRISNALDIVVTQDEFDALCDFAWNCGIDALLGSTLWKDLNQGQFEAAAKQFELWDKSHGAVIAGLLRRRVAEEKLFNTSDPA